MIEDYIDYKFTDNELDNALFVEFNKPILDRDKINELILRGANINAIDDSGFSAFLFLFFNWIHEKSENEDFVLRLDDIQYVIDLGADVNYICDGWCHCLYIAANHLNCEQQREVVEMLLKAGANPNNPTCFCNGSSILENAIDAGGHYDKKQKEWIDDGTMDDIIELLEDYGAKYSEDLYTNEVEDFLTVCASYPTGLFTKGGSIKIENIPNVPEELIIAFKRWQATNPDKTENYYRDKIWNEKLKRNMDSPRQKTKMNIDFFKIHNYLGKLYSKEIKNLIGQDIKVEYYYIKAIDLANDKGRNQGYLNI
jgi:hypothetical protein